MNQLKKVLTGQVLIILLMTGIIGVIGYKSDINLGLDLKGGTQLDYKIDLAKVAQGDQAQIVEGVKEVIRKRVDQLGVAEPNIYVSNIADEYHVVVELAGINDIEEAKAIVGKTIQLEFKEENPNPQDEEKLKLANEEATIFYNDLKAGGDFVTLGEAEQNAMPGQVYHFEQNLQELSKYSPEMQEAIKGKSAGTILAPFEISDGLTADAQDQMVELNGVAVVQIADKSTELKEITENIVVSARHILVSYTGAERSSSTRTKEEALTRAQEVKAKIDGGAQLADLSKEYSDDQGSYAKGGDLGEFGEGVMTPTFQDAAFALSVGEVSDIVESPFGFHIIQVYKKTGGTVTKQEVESYQINKIIYLTKADEWRDAGLNGEHFKHADVAFNQAYQPYVAIEFDDEGGKIFEDLTGANVGKRIAIFVGGTLISAPTVQNKIAGGSAQITGNFTIDEAQDLARDLNTGAIPAPITLSGQYTISATLGSEALNQSLKAGLIGVIALALFMLLYYRVPGLVANVALAIYSLILLFFIKSALPIAIAILLALGIFVYVVHLLLKSKDSGGEKFVSFIIACFVLFFLTFVFSSKITLTLAGIAGVILSIGMAVDANILIFERVKEELRAGKSLKTAIEEGFDRAWDSIRDSNFSSLITCAILFYFGTSIIRGFALNLALGILVSMFSAIMLTRTFLNFAAETPLANNLRLWGKPAHEKTGHMKFVKYKNFWLGLSGTVVLASFLLMGIIGLKMGLDFTGGTMIEVKLGSTDATSEQISTAIKEAGDFGEAHIVSTNEGTYLIRMKHLSEEDHNTVLAKLKEKFTSADELRFTTVGPTIGATLKNKALIALLLTSLMIVLYISFAFRRIPRELSPWKFGLAAIVALIHDVAIVIGIFVLLGKFMGVEVDALFITALLTVMGFSVHDTIVVFDRLRENLRFRKEGEALSETVDHALNQTMARSINTSLSVLITTVALLIFGAASIKMFILALTIGIFVGTYSSIFVASFLLVSWNKKK
ncbi:protein translocase subunit SecF [Candidatus Peregrinibacteria bacterium]|nr:protein translocase subunit SecF [Candidatus Peregrinibacteria bacterium]